MNFRWYVVFLFVILLLNVSYNIDEEKKYIVLYEKEEVDG